MSDTFDRLNIYLERVRKLSAASTIMSWDLQTMAPKDAVDGMVDVMGEFSSEIFSIMTSDEVKELIQKLQKDDSLTDIQRKIVNKAAEDVKTNEKVDKGDQRQLDELTMKANSVWSEAKDAKDFSIFAPYLEKIIKLSKKIAQDKAENNQKIYDVCLDESEEGFTMDVLDPFFEKIRKAIVPLLHKIEEKEGMINKEYNYKQYDIEKQKEFTKWIAGYMGFNTDRGAISESAHPFTTAVNNKNVRITTHYHEDNLENAIFSTIHECGHALFEMGVSDEYTDTIIGNSAITCGIHESQARFFENMIGRSFYFWKPIYGKLLETFPSQLEDVSLEQFIKGINKVRPGLIRIEADELTYSLHIMIRYEIEKKIFNEDVDIDSLPQIWDDMYEEYIGVRPESCSEGILQDVHWSGGSFGYFPSYVIGNAIAAQVYYYMREQIDVDGALEKGDIGQIVNFLHEHIHRYGGSKKVNEILTDMMGEKLNPDYYIRYLSEKYKMIYELDEN